MPAQVGHFAATLCGATSNGCFAAVTSGIAGHALRDHRDDLPRPAGLFAEGGSLRCGRLFQQMVDRAKFLTNDALREIRNRTDWRALFVVLGIEKDERRSKDHDWWGCSPLAEERTPSFHMNDRGWHCFSTNEGGGPIELVQAVLRRRGEVLSCYDAGRWLVEHGVCSGTTLPHPPAVAPRSEKGKAENLPIRQDLMPRLTLQGEHPEFIRRGIGRETCAYLGCGYLETAKSPLAGRLVFQVRGVQETEGSDLEPVILTHMGRATTAEQEAADGKWWLYGGFTKTLELYNLDKLLLDPGAAKQTQDRGFVVITEGAFDVAKLIEAGIRNTVATFGAHLAETQLARLDLIGRHLGVRKVLLAYDRDRAGRDGDGRARELLQQAGFEVAGFDWNMTFPSPRRGEVRIPPDITDVGKFSVEQLQWLRGRGAI